MRLWSQFNIRFVEFSWKQGENKKNKESIFGVDPHAVRVENF